MNTLNMHTVTIEKNELLALTDGTTDKQGRQKGVIMGKAKWGLLAQYLRTEGPEMLLAFIDDYIGTSATVDPTPATVPAPPPAVPTVPVPVPALTVPTPPPVPVATVPPAVPSPAPTVPTVKPSHSLDYCKTRMQYKGMTLGLRDGIVYRWFTPAGDAAHYRAYKGKDVTAASFTAPTVAPTVKAPAPVKLAPTVPTVPVAPCETLPAGVLARFEHAGLIVTLYLTLPGEKSGRYTLEPAPAKV